MTQQHSIRMTQINFPGGLIAVAPTDQWIACLFDVLHPMQQESILRRIQELGEAQKEQPLVIAPGHNIMNPFTKAD